MKRGHGRRERMLDALADDIRHHLETETQDNIARGMSPAEARIAALRKFGNPTRVTEDAREVWSIVWLEQLLEDARYALRSLRKSPGFTAVAILTIALSIGATTAIFSVVDATILRPLPYPHAERIVTLTGTKSEEGLTNPGIPYLDFEELRAQNHVFDFLAANNAHQLTLTGRGEPSVVTSWDVTPDYMNVLGWQPLLGHSFFP